MMVMYFIDDSLLVCVVLGHYKAETSAACCVAGGSSIYNDQGSFSFLLEHRSSSVRRSSGRHPQHHSSSKTTMDLPHTLMIKNDNRESGFRLVLGQLVRIVTQKSFVQIWQYQYQKYNQPESFLASLGVGHWPCYQVVLCSNPEEVELSSTPVDMWTQGHVHIKDWQPP